MRPKSISVAVSLSQHTLVGCCTADRLRTFGWVVPAYTLAKDNQQRKVLRVVCRWDFNATLVAELLDNLQESMDWLEVCDTPE